MFESLQVMVAASPELANWYDTRTTTIDPAAGLKLVVDDATPALAVASVAVTAVYPSDIDYLRPVAQYPPAKDTHHFDLPAFHSPTM